MWASCDSRWITGISTQAYGIFALGWPLTIECGSEGTLHQLCECSALVCWHHLMRYGASLWRRITRVSSPPQICPGLTSDWPQNAGHFTQVHACYYTIRVTAINSPDLKYCKGDREENVNFLQRRQRTRQESHEMSDCCLQSVEYDVCRDYAVNMQSTIRLYVAWKLLYVRFFFLFKKVCKFYNSFCQNLFDS